MNLMIVDDSDLLQLRLGNAFKKVNPEIQITCAHSCKEAIDLFNPDEQDQIVLDLSLPDGSGINLLKLFKKSRPSIKVIIFTNYPTQEFEKSCLALGADEFIDKKNFNQLIKLIK